MGVGLGQKKGCEKFCWTSGNQVLVLVFVLVLVLVLVLILVLQYWYPLMDLGQPGIGIGIAIFVSTYGLRATRPTRRDRSSLPCTAEDFHFFCGRTRNNCEQKLKIKDKR